MSKSVYHTKKGVVVIVRSCLTGKPVWLYRGASLHGSESAYWRACKYEIERFRGWSRTVARRKANIQRLLSECMAGLGINAALTPEQKAAAKRLASYAEPPAYYREFYDHVMEERRRRKRDRQIREQMRLRDSQNRDYGKREGKE